MLQNLTEEKIEESYLLKPQDISFFLNMEVLLIVLMNLIVLMISLEQKEKKPKVYLNLLAISRY